MCLRSFIRSTVVDTDSVGFCDVTGGSRVTMASGWAVVLAVEELIEELRVSCSYGCGNWM